MDRAVKHELSDELRERLSKSPAFVLLEFDKLTVAAANDLRGKFRAAGCFYRVYKNSTIQYAIEGTDHAAAIPLLRGVTGLAYHQDDPGAAARVARAFAKDNDKVRIKGGVMEGTALDPDGVSRLADMPGPDQIRATLLALFNTPATQFLRVLQAVPQGIMNVINAKKDKDEQG